MLRYIFFDPDCVTDIRVEGYTAPMRDPSTLRALSVTARQILPDDLDDLVAT